MEEEGWRKEEAEGCSVDIVYPAFLPQESGVYIVLVPGNSCF